MHEVGMTLRVTFLLLTISNLLHCFDKVAISHSESLADINLEKKCADFPASCRTFPESCSGANCHVKILWTDTDGTDPVNFLVSGKRNTVQWIALNFFNQELEAVSAVRCGLPMATNPVVYGMVKKDSSVEEDWKKQTGDVDTMLDEYRYICRFNKVVTPTLVSYVKLNYETLNKEVISSELIELKLAGSKFRSALDHEAVVLHRSRRDIEGNYTAGCGETKGCFSQAGCLFTYAMTTDVDGTEYLRVQLESDQGRDWIAVGFSRNTFMRETSIVECMKAPNGSIIVQHSYNPGYSNQVIDSRGIKVIEAGVVNNSIKCSFDRKTVYDGPDADPRLYNITEEYHIILARGPVNAQGLKSKHVETPAPSPLMNLSDFQVSSSPPPSGMCPGCTVKAHACLMISAWVFLASLGIFMPRYAKPYLSERQIFKSAAWFVMHRIIMVLCWCCTAAGFIIIFVLKNGVYISFPPTEPSYYNAHPAIGITVMILVTLNPIMALFRCHPDHRRRPIFNWTHLSVGTCAQILAVINIFFGLEIATFSSIVFWLMVAYISFHVIMEIALSITKYAPSATVAKLETEGAEEVRKGRIIPTFTLYGLYAIVVTGLWIAMVVLIATS